MAETESPRLFLDLPFSTQAAAAAAEEVITLSPLDPAELAAGEVVVSPVLPRVAPQILAVAVVVVVTADSTETAPLAAPAS